MIPQHITLFCGDFEKKRTWRKIGFTTFNENKAGLQRELKTINLHEFHIQGQYLKLEVHKCYNNRRNLFNKVSLEAVYIIGTKVVTKLPQSAQKKLRQAEGDVFKGLEKLYEEGLGM